MFWEITALKGVVYRIDFRSMDLWYFRLHFEEKFTPLG
jgi:hypothetical protein